MSLTGGRPPRRGWPPWIEALIAGAVLGPSTMIIYRLAAAQGAGQETLVPWWLDTPLDRLMPVVPVAVWVYLSWYPTIALLALADRATVRRGYVAFALAFLLCSAGHFLLPVSIERPLLDAGDGPSAQLLIRLYAFDPPRNLFPSFHAAGAGVLTALRPRATWLSWAVPLWAVALCAACVLVKQHYLVDIVCGYGIGLGAAAAVGAPGLGHCGPLRVKSCKAAHRPSESRHRAPTCTRR